MHIKYFATFRELAGERSFDLDEPPPDVAGLLELLATRYGDRFRRAVLADGHLGPELILLVNGRNVRLTGGLATPLTPRDDVSVFPMVAGG
ncbi:MoaD family protein [Streptomyces cavernae]|uniref:MoaD family protein n=1 Tax=Streptomyces cavernae TaxID=2259034 RepID=UPI000FEBFF78|nr:MoaD family protein [Streptomyces cavernae]